MLRIVDWFDIVLVVVIVVQNAVLVKVMIALAMMLPIPVDVLQRLSSVRVKMPLSVVHVLIRCLLLTPPAKSVMVDIIFKSFFMGVISVLCGISMIVDGLIVMLVGELLIKNAMFSLAHLSLIVETPRIFFLLIVGVMSIVIFKVSRLVGVVSASMMCVLTVGHVVVMVTWIVLVTILSGKDLTIRLLLLVDLSDWFLLMMTWCRLNRLMMNRSMCSGHCFGMRNWHLRVGSYISMRCSM